MTRKKGGSAAITKATKKSKAQQGKAAVFSLEHAFAIQDTRTFRDPFVGLNWEIARIGYRPYQDWMKVNQKSSPVYSAMAGAVMQAQVLEGIQKRKKKKGKRPGSFIAQESMVERALSKIDWGELDLTDLAPREGAAEHLVHSITSDSESDIEFGVVIRVCGECEHIWKDLDVLECPECSHQKFEDGVEPVAYTAEAGIQIFSNTSPLPVEVVEKAFPPEESEESPGEMELGAALYAWVLLKASDTENYRQKHLGAAEGN